jgi:glycosyltransferase involved in cell wall biosynthesis
MLTILLWIAAVVWIIFFLQMLLNRALTRDLSRLRLDPPEKWPLVSIVVPARNEERGIRDAVTSFCRQDYLSLEVIVVDDRSTDGTPLTLSELRKEFTNLKVIRCEDPPEGWLGKPNALETGKKEARGEWILFADADPVFSPDLLRKAVSLALREKTSMLVLAPVITTAGLVEALGITGLYLLFGVAFPVFLISRTKSSLFAIGAGTFNFVRRDALAESDAFRSIRDSVADDVALGYAVKRAGHRISAALAPSLISLRMYHGAAETINGFTKNAYTIFRKVKWIVPFLLCLGFLQNILPYICLFVQIVGRDLSATALLSNPAFLSLLLMHLTMAGIVYTFRLPWYIVFLNPLVQFLWWWILFRSFLMYRRKGIVWRGRTYRSDH